MNTAALAITVGGTTVPWVIAVAAGWHLVRTGRLRLASPTAAQLQAERDTGEGNGADRG